MYAILAEDDSDAEVLEHIIRRRFNRNLTIKKKGYGGCGALLRKGMRDINSWKTSGANGIIVCHDSDRHSPTSIREKVNRLVVNPSQFDGPTCIVVPVQEIESWIIADEAAVKKVIPSFDFKGHKNPESLDDPKEWLCAESKASNGKPLYAPKVFNPAVARELDMEEVAKKCKSFEFFLTWVDCQRNQPK